MPIYEYRCDKCGQFEEIQKITDPALKKCPKCKGKVTKLMSNTSFQLKGSGWYVTDYGRSGSGKSSAGSESKGDSSTGGESKGDSSSGKDAPKEAAKSEAKSSDSKSDAKKSDTKAAAA